jgi:phosphoribosyl 1,2-cyclic phosphate phosphodiesterase
MDKIVAGTHTLTFLGTGGACGVPSFYCGCKACDEALTNPRAARDCAGLLIQGELSTLIDTPPQLRTQLIRERTADIDHVLYTHEHFDHLGGLPQLEFYVRMKTHQPLPVYAGRETQAAIEVQYSYLIDTLDCHLLEAFTSVELDGVRYTPLPAAHSPGAFGFLIETATSCMAYFPDTGPLPDVTLVHLSELGAHDALDVLAIDSTFNGTNWMHATHHSIDQAIDLIKQVGAKQGYLTHLTMHYDTPITLAELEEKLAVYDGRIAVAYDGLRITI